MTATRGATWRHPVPEGHRLDPRVSERSVPDAFRTALRTNPSAIAVIADRTLTYEVLDAESSNLAAALGGEVGRGSAPVAILTGHSAGAVVSILGTAKAARPSAVLDPLAPAAFLEDVANRLEPAAMVTDTEHRDLAHRLAADVPLLDVDELDGDGTDLELEIDPRDVATICFTSGSSGTPKGVIHSHRNVVHNSAQFAAVTDMTSDDRVLVGTQLAFVASGTPLHAALLTGAAACPYVVALQPAASFPAFVRQHGITVLHLTAAHISAFPKGAAAPVELGSVRLVSIGGDRLRGQAIGRLRRSLPSDATILYRLSVSETHWIAGVIIGPDAELDDGPIPVGWPMPWLDVEIRGNDGLPVADGEHGQLVVRGDHLALGYWHDERRTTEHFAVADSVREFRTTDRVWRRPDGMLVHEGRDEATMKVRGVLVDPVRVERTIEGLDGVTAAAVVPWHLTDGETRLAAFAAGDTVRGRDIRRALVALLPPAMIPARIVPVGELPMNARGKVDVAALEQLAQSLPRPPFAAPQGPHEEVIARLFGELLSVEAVGRDDDFYDLGGDSLATIELVEGVDAELGVDLDPSALLSAPTPAALAASIGRGDTTRSTAVVLRTGSSAKVAVCCVTGGGGQAHSLRDLAVALGDRTFVGLQAWGVEHRAFPDRTIEANAARHLRDLRAVRPTGPYVLAGYSSGGIIAYEMAQQLGTDGEGSVVVFLDTGSPEVGRHHRAQRYVKSQKTLARSKYGPGVRRTTRILTAYTRAAVHTVVAFGRAGTAGIVRRTPEGQRRAFSMLRSRMYRRYEVKPYAGAVVLVRATNTNIRDMRWQDPTLGWGRFASNISLVDVPSTHRALVRRPTAGLVAATIESIAAPLDAALGEWSRP